MLEVLSAVIGAIGGYIGPLIPKAFKLYEEKKKTELRQKHELDLANSNNAKEAMEAYYAYLSKESEVDIEKQKNYRTGIKWVDAIGGLVRPYGGFMAINLFFYCVATDKILSPAELGILVGIFSYFYSYRQELKLEAIRLNKKC